MNQPDDNKKTNLLIAAGIFPPDIGGPATHAYLLYQELPRFDFDVRVIAYGEVEPETSKPRNPETAQVRTAESAPEASKNIKKSNNIIRIGRSLNILTRYFRYFWNVYKQKSWADVVYVQGPVSEGWPAYLACRLAGKKYFLKIVGDYAWEQGRQRFGVVDNLEEFQVKKYPWPVDFMKWIEKRVARGAWKIIVPSHYLENIVKRWGVSDDKIEVIYNSVEPAVFLTREQAKEKHSLRGDIILTVARLVPWKGIGALIEIMPELLSANRNFLLVIAGDGPLQDELHSKAKSAGIAGKIIFTGRLGAKEVKEYMAAADYFVLNSSYEGLSHVLLEAMRAGAVILASQAGGNTELIEHGRNGILFEYNNKEQIKSAIISLWKNPGKKVSWAGENRKRLEKFSKEEMLNRTAALLTNK